MKRVVIVGGGISGLTVAYALLNSSQLLAAKGEPSPRGEATGRQGRVLGSQVDVTVFEADARPGGKIWSDGVDGFLCEKGANGFLDNKPQTFRLCREVGIEPLKSNDNAKRRYIFSSGKLNLLSESPLSFLKSGLLSWHGKLRILYELVVPKGPEDETVADFVIRRLGKEGLEKLIDPMSSGIFAGDPYRMSIKYCFPRIKELEQEYGSLIRAMIKLQRAKSRKQKVEKDKTPDSPASLREAGRAQFITDDRTGPGIGGNLTSFYNGVQVITDALAKRLGERIKLGVSVHGLEKEGDSFKLHTSEGTTDADVVVLASPAYASAEIIKEFDLEFSRILSGIPYASVSVVCLGFKKEKILHSLKGFGFLVPHKEGRKILGTLWDSSIFPNRAPEGQVLLRTMVGGTRSPELAALNNDKLANTVFDELKHIVSLKAEPDMVRIYRWERAIPQYILGHGEKLRFMDERLKSYPGLYFTGNAYRGVSMNDCIENGYRLADEILSSL